jgi:hypothetical protein
VNEDRKQAFRNAHRRVAKMKVQPPEKYRPPSAQLAKRPTLPKLKFLEEEYDENE